MHNNFFKLKFCLLDSCPSWLIKEARADLRQWLALIIETPLSSGEFLVQQKKAVIPPLLKKTFFGSIHLGEL